MSNLTVIQEVEFSMDDVSDEVDFYVTDEIGDDVVFDSETIQEIFDVIVDSVWFIQGNKTEGVLSIGKKLEVGRELNLSWSSINMEITDGGDIFDDTEDHEMDFVLTLESGKWVLTPR